MLSMMRTKEGRSSGAAFRYASSGAGVLTSRSRSSRSQLGPNAEPGSPGDGFVRGMILSHSALSVVSTPRPVIVTLCRFRPPISGTGVMHSTPCTLPCVNGSLPAGKRRVAPASMWSTRSLTSSRGPVT